MILTPVQTFANVAEDLRDDEIHVWHVDYQRHHGRAPLRRVLSAYLGLPPQDILFIEGEHGRPSLAPLAREQSLGFNWSHTGNHALIAVGRHLSPGVDVERQRARPRALEIAQRYFAPEESAALEALSGEQRHTAFLELWTAKEAVLKALGRGIAFGLDRLSVGRGVDTLELLHLEGDDVDQWQLRRLTLNARLVAALAWRGAPRRVRLGALAIGD